jgi:hypothetical protein
MIEKINFMGRVEPAHLPQAALKLIEEETGFSVSKLLKSISSLGEGAGEKDFGFLMFNELESHASAIVYYALRFGAKNQGRFVEMGVLAEAVNAKPRIEMFDSVEDFAEMAALSEVLPAAIRLVTGQLQSLNVPTAEAGQETTTEPPSPQKKKAT